VAGLRLDLEGGRAQTPPFNRESHRLGGIPPAASAPEGACGAPDGRRVVSGAGYDSLRVWDLEGGG
jgi:hypothetical protein